MQCPTLLYNGYGAHRIEGIGDKHVPWIHNVKNTDMVVGIDDEATIQLMRLFNEEAGQAYLVEKGVAADVVEQLPNLGISCIANMLSAIKMAKYYEMGPNDVVLTVATDSMEMYGSRLDEYRELEGPFTPLDAAYVTGRYLDGTNIDHMQELTYVDRKRIHNLKYFTWIEQQGRELDELNAQWYDPTYWTGIHGMDRQIDKLIESFNERVGLLQEVG